MTLKQFTQKLARKYRRVRSRTMKAHTRCKGHLIRIGKPGAAPSHCPITFLDKKATDEDCYPEAARRLGLTYRQRNLIIGAADNGFCINPKLRAEINKALGLKGA